MSKISKRSNHRHDYEAVIIEEEIDSVKYRWGRRCRLCGRVDDAGMFKIATFEDFVKDRVEVSLGSATYTFRIFYPLSAIKAKYPGIAVLKYDYKKKAYEEVTG